MLAPLFPMELLSTAPHKFDFSKHNPAIKNIDMNKPGDLERHINEVLKTTGKRWGYGGWGEDRFLYQSSDLFRSGDGHRSIHLGIDIWLPTGTPLFAPIAGTVHSFNDNQHFLDYGPTIITQHEIGGHKFYILYGHLSRSSLTGLQEGRTVRLGDQIATVGESHENGNWPSHVHLQLMRDMGDKHGDFPGVAVPADKMHMLEVCPNPESLFGQFVVA